jgi:hypothetical protein
MDASSLNDLQRKQLERNISDEEGTAAAYRESGGDPTKLRSFCTARASISQRWLRRRMRWR